MKRLGYLLKAHKVALFVVEGDGKRFARLFRETWKRIPLGARRPLCKLWRHSSDGWPLPFRAQVTLEAGWSMDRKSDEGGWNHASASNLGFPGRVFKFFGALLDRMPDEHAKCLIAHELGHAVFRAIDRPCDGEDDDFWEHCELSEMLDAWGFDGEAMDR